jgi:nucleoside-diphosphate-sugar epimerase
MEGMKKADIDITRNYLKWTTTFTMHNGLQATVSWYRSQNELGKL